MIGQNFPFRGDDLDMMTKWRWTRF